MKGPIQNAGKDFTPLGLYNCPRLFILPVFNGDHLADAEMYRRNSGTDRDT
jgi:hypothetical protein